MIEARRVAEALSSLYYTSGGLPPQEKGLRVCFTNPERKRVSGFVLKPESNK
jgi:hypothetical protein